MKRISDLQRLATEAGATLEEDEPTRDTRVFQIVAPAGFVWSDGKVTSLRVDWGRGDRPGVAEYNEDAFADAASRVACGIEPE